jgi:tetratricopeptide (TPR) repeat protein
MKKTVFIFAAFLFGACMSFLLSAQDRSAAQESPAPATMPPDLADLQLSEPRRLELQDAFKRRDYKRAETILVEEAERDPKSIRTAKILTMAGAIFFLDGQYLNSAIAWKKAEAIAPLDDRNRFTLAMAYVRLNRRDWARPELEKLVAAQPQDSLYLYWLARLDFDAKSYATAISRLRKVVELDPTMMRAYDSLGLCYDYLGQSHEAIKNFNRAVELNRLQPKPSPWPHVDLAISLVSVNQLADAEKHLREALDFDPRLPQAHYQLGRVLEMQGSYQAAVLSLNQSIALAPAYPEPHYLLGRIYHRLGDDQLSKKEIGRFQELKRASEAPSVSGSSPPHNLQ